MRPTRTPPCGPPGLRPEYMADGTGNQPAPPRPARRKSSPEPAFASTTGAAKRQTLTVAAAMIVFLLALGVVLLVARAAAAEGALPPPSSSPLRLRLQPGPSHGVPLVALPWGDGPAAVGLDPAGEGLRRAPWTFAVAPSGRLVVLDEVNERLLLLEAGGRPLGTIPVGLADPRFLAADDTTIHVLDADADRQLTSVDWSGRLLAEIGFPPMDEPVSGLLVRDGIPYVEVSHSDVYEVRPGQTADTTVTGADLARAEPSGPPASVASGRPYPAYAALTRVPGRPLKSARYDTVRVSFYPPDRARLQLAPSHGNDHPGLSDQIRYGQVTDDPTLPDTPGEELQVVFPEPIEHLVSIDGDRSGGIVLGARLLSGTGSQGPPLVVGRLPAGPSSGAQPLPVSEPHDGVPTLLLEEECAYGETGQPYVSGPDGSVYQARTSSGGYSILLHTFPEG